MNQWQNREKPQEENTKFKETWKQRKLTDKIQWAGERWAGCRWGEDRASSACRQSSGQVLPLTQSRDHLTLCWIHSSVATHTHTLKNVFIAAHLYFTPLHSISEPSSVRKKWQRNWKKKEKEKALAHTGAWNFESRAVSREIQQKKKKKKHPSLQTGSLKWSLMLVFVSLSPLTALN